MNRIRRLDDRQIDMGTLALRSALAFLSVLAVVLPILNVIFADGPDALRLGDFRLLAMAAYLLPLAYVAGLAAVFVDGMRSHALFIDLTGVVVGAVAVLRTSYVLFSDAATGSEIIGEFVSVSLGSGAVPLLLLLLGGSWLLQKTWLD
ncbi:hypothetical protein QTL95_11155 [Rhizobium sp. S152]|uniref:hypothetical protein n=1 Tax=Rhizobium sp. S152 TaxID=3055038 RepID=UPI0025A9B8CE|nr:hypothetical protein [Rhizobium sp. S152]MDM9626457.1 hypothetical protein [Rhizobium sp. S152]